MIKVTFEGYNEKREKMQLVKIGELVKETEKQIVVNEPLGATCTINKSKIIERIDDYVLPENEVVEVVDEPINMKVLLPHVKDYYRYIEKIQRCEESILESFFDIGRYLNIISNDKLYELENYKDIYEFAEDKFNYKKTSVVNMISVYEKYKDEDDDKAIAEDFADYGYTALVELLPVPKEEIKENYTPADTIVDIRKSKKLSKLDNHVKDMVKKYDSVYKKVCKLIEENNKELKSKKGIIKTEAFSKRINIDNFYYCNYFKCDEYKSPFSYSGFNLILDMEVVRFKNKDFSFNDLGFETKIINYFRDLLEEHNKLFVKEEKNKEKIVKEIPLYTSSYYVHVIKDIRLQFIYSFFKSFFGCLFGSVRVFNKESNIGDYKLKVNDVLEEVNLITETNYYILYRKDADFDNFLLLNEAGKICASFDTNCLDFTNSFFKEKFINFLYTLQDIVNRANSSDSLDDEEEPEDYGDVDE